VEGVESGTRTALLDDPRDYCLMLQPNSPPPPDLGSTGRIVEGIVTTKSADETVNFSPMGPIVDDALDRLWLRPFQTSTTFQNLKRDRVGVFHITDDVELIAHAAVGQPDPAPRLLPSLGGRGAIIATACRWYVFEVESLDDSTERTSIVARVLDRGVLREFLGFNRAKHAVLEAAILATRVHMLDPNEVLTEIVRLAPLVEKTGAAPERRAFTFLREYVRQSTRS
jgi:uncharacterized protein